MSHTMSTPISARRGSCCCAAANVPSGVYWRNTLFVQSLYKGRLVGDTRRFDDLRGCEDALYGVSSLLVLHTPLIESLTIAWCYCAHIREQNIEALLAAKNWLLI